MDGVMPSTLSPAQELANNIDKFGLTILDISKRKVVLLRKRNMTNEQEKEVRGFVTQFIAANTRIEYVV